MSIPTIARVTPERLSRWHAESARAAADHPHQAGVDIKHSGGSLPGIILYPIRFPNATIASARIVRLLKQWLDWPVVDRAELAQQVKRAETVIIVNTALNFCLFIPEVARLISKASRVIWCQDDYNLRIPSPTGSAESMIHKATREQLNKGNVVPWTTVSRVAANLGGRRVNWNILGLSEPQHLLMHGLRWETMFYYGTYRPGRVKMFNRLMGDGSGCLISATAGEAKKFKHAHPQASLMPQMIGGLSTLGAVKATLYAQDTFGNKVRCSPSARLYEALSHRTAIAFDAATRESLSGDDVELKDEWMISSAAEIPAFLERSDRVKNQQAAAFTPQRCYAELAQQLAAARETLL